MLEPAFDRIAKAYDEQFTYSPIGRMQRLSVYHRLELLMKKEIEDIIELNCGTGEDACWLACQDKKVIATDQSAEMIKVARFKANAQFANKRFQPRFAVLSIEDVPTFFNDKKVDLIFSNFGGLNCIPPDALKKMATQIPAILKEDAYLAFVVMGNFCLWETLYFLGKRNWSKAWRRFTKGPVSAKLAKGVHIPTWYYKPTFISKLFSKDFEVIEVKPIGWALPPSYLDPFFKKKPKTLAMLNHYETKLRNYSWLSKLSDHYWILLKKKE